MKSREEILDILRQHKASLMQKYPIDYIAIFGSYSRNAQNENSDVDILVEFHDRIGSSFIDFANEVERLLGVRTDVVSKGAIKPKYYSAIQSDLTYV